MRFAETKHCKRTTKSPIQNQNWHKKKTGAKWGATGYNKENKGDWT